MPAGNWGARSFEPSNDVAGSVTFSELPAQSDKTASGEPIPIGEEASHLTRIEPRKVVYTGTFVVVVSDVNVAMSAVRDLAGKMGGYMQSMTAGDIVIRVPAAGFDRAVKALEETGTIIDRNITAQDVTEQYVDLELRIRNAKALLAKLRNLLEKAQNVKEALAVEKELSRVRTEVERMEGRLNRLRNRVAMATLTIRFQRVKDMPGELRTKLPFWWLSRLGLDELLEF